MRPRVAIATCLATLATATSTQASFRVVNDTGAPTGGQLQQWADTLPYGHGDITVSFTNPDGREEPMYTSAKSPVYITRTARADGFTRDAFAHELGHHIDYQIPEATRLFIQSRVLHRTGPWAQGPDSAKEQFAEAVSLLGQHANSGGYNTRLGPHRKQLLHRVLTTPNAPTARLEEMHTTAVRRWARSAETHRPAPRLAVSLKPSN